MKNGKHLTRILLLCIALLGFTAVCLAESPVTFSAENVSVNYALYADRNSEPIETTNADLIVENDPETVRMDVTADLAGGISVTLHYYLSVQE